MLRKRIIVCLDVQDGRAVTGTRSEPARDLGDPVELAQRYEAEGADEIVFLDVSASAEGRRTLLDVVSRTAQSLFIPLTVGGGINEVADVALALRAGADKVSINTAGVKRPELIGEASVRFGKQSVVASIDARLEKRQIELVAHTEGTTAPPALGAAMGAGSATSPHGPAGNPASTGTWFRVFTHGGRTATELDAITWAKQCANMGAGEILVTSIDQGGRRAGYDLELTARIVEAVNVPVIASGGAGTPEHIRDVFLLAGADAALAAAIFHEGVSTVQAVKHMLAEAGIPVRPIETPAPSR
ncbi:MAG: imidazole glycerol phosphate synthase subunit HisF [Gemmatimonadota bacterium]